MASILLSPSLTLIPLQGAVSPYISAATTRRFSFYPSSHSRSRLPRSSPRLPTLGCLATMAEGEVGRSNGALEKVAIVGGGLGGLAAAIALRSRGIDAQVYEKNSTIAGGEGTMISLFPNGVRALSLADPAIVSKLVAAGVANPVSANYTPGGQLVAQWDVSSKMEGIYGFPMIAIRWREVLDVFSQALPSSCIHTGHELVGIQQDEERVVATFKTGDGETVVETPLLIGADGIRSIVRQKVAPSYPPLHDNERSIWRAIIPFDRCSHPIVTPGHIAAIVGEGRTAVISDAGKNSLYWAYTVMDEVRGGQALERSQNGGEAKERLKQYFEGWDLALHVLEVTEPDAILERRVVDLPVLDRWAYGRVVLLGDAVHAVVPSLGQGANLAFEDAWELACQLAAQPTLRSALESYEAVRVPRAQAIATQSSTQSARTYAKQAPPPKWGDAAGFYDYMYSYEGGKTG